LTDFKFNKKTGTRTFTKDQEVEEKLKNLIKKHNISPLELLYNFPIFARRTSIKRFLAHYELFRKTITLPGDIVELGVYRGASLMSWANFLEARNIGDRTKKIWAFDNFEGFGDFVDQDGPQYPEINKVKGGWSPAKFYEELKDVIEVFDMDRFVGWKKRIELVEGDVEKTLPEFIKKNPGLRISLLHIDIDLYKPTKVAMELLFTRVVKGGVIIFDDYSSLEFGGETAAVEEYLSNSDYEINKFDWNNVPGGFIIK
jgi:hypothetical protein